MRLTAPTGVSDRAVTEETLLAVVNQEFRPLLRQMRAGVNARSIVRPPPVVSDGASSWTTLWTSDELQQDVVVTVEAHVQGISAADRCCYVLERAVDSMAGSLFENPMVILYDFAIDPTATARIVADLTARTVSVEARDAGVGSMQWTAVVYLNEALPEE